MLKHHSGQLFPIALLALLAVVIFIFLALRYADQMLNILGDAGTAVLLRLSSFILLCLGVQIIWGGASELLMEVLHAAMKDG